MKKIFPILTIFVCLITTGCFSTTKLIKVNTVSDFERRYTENDSLIVDNTPVVIPHGTGVWVLRDETLEILLLNASINNVSLMEKIVP